MRRSPRAALAALLVLLVSIVPALPVSVASAATLPSPPAAVTYHAVQMRGSNGWAVGGFQSGSTYAVVARTTDGGATWEARTVAQTQAFKSVSMVSDSVGYAVNEMPLAIGPNVFKTVDGGLNWSPMAYVSPSPGMWPTAFHSVRFIDEQHGVVVGTGPDTRPVIWTTGTGGASWSQSYIEPLESDGETGQTLNSGRFYGVDGYDATHLIAVGGVAYPAVSGMAFRTANGSLWTTETAPAADEYDAVAYPSSSRALAVGKVGAAAKFNGTSWSSVPVGGANDMFAVAYPDPAKAWAVGAAGDIRFFDGTAWHPQTSNVSSTLRGVSFSSVTNGVAVGDGGVILRTTNGGTTWVRVEPAELPAPVVVSAGFSNSIAYELKSFLTTTFKFTSDQPGVAAKVVVKSPSGDAVVYDSKGASVGNQANVEHSLPSWNGLRNGARLTSASYDWVLTLTKNGKTTTKTGKITISKVLFQMKGVSAGKANAHPAYMIPGNANVYMTATTTSTTDALNISLSGPSGYFAKPQTSAGAYPPYSFGSATPLNVTAYIRGTKALRYRAIHTFSITGTKRVTYAVTVIQ